MKQSMSQKPLASLSLDLDNKWSYMKTHGHPDWKKLPSYFNVAVPNILDALAAHNLTITFFIVGQDAARAENRDDLQSIVAAGHEVGNHSFNHDPWLHLYDKERIRSEILDAEEAIYDVTGQRPVGFRGPGFSWSKTLIEVLIENHYLFDASTLPTYLAPLARAYFLAKSRLTKEERQQRKGLFGSFRNGFLPVKAHWLSNSSEDSLLEIPVTTMPIFKIPFHLSYLIYLAGYSERLMRSYLRIAIILARATHTEPSFLLHPLDFIGAKEAPELSFFPAMQIEAEKKREIFDQVIDMLEEHFTLVPMSTHARSIKQKTNLKTVKFE